MSWAYLLPVVSNVNEKPPDKYAESRFPAGYNNILGLRSASVRNLDEKPPDKYGESRFPGGYNNVLGFPSASESARILRRGRAVAGEGYEDSGLGTRAMAATVTQIHRAVWP
ncbi:hypothetical protein AVEN_186154-1 [Araneus ventricosus]|uniref:Uncharacterized protein n=1 Tax=Araneus ventricosus TaxID=182803 RepID=A0A4Y2DSS1_ARAVE|nr:hypothetical protein AVEN_186154-1 [Araneus ventricosus]